MFRLPFHSHITSGHGLAHKCVRFCEAKSQFQFNWIDRVFDVSLWNLRAPQAACITPGTALRRQLTKIVDWVGINRRYRDYKFHVWCHSDTKFIDNRSASVKQHNMNRSTATNKTGCLICVMMRHGSSYTCWPTT